MGISKNTWTLWFIGREELVGENGAASDAFDCNAGTIWHTEYLQVDESFLGC